MKIVIAVIVFGFLYGVLGAGLFNSFAVPKEHLTFGLVQAASFFVYGCVWTNFLNYLLEKAQNEKA